jgi:hypothetical protein
MKREKQKTCIRPKRRRCLLGPIFIFLISSSSLRPVPRSVVPHRRLLVPAIHPASSGSQRLGAGAGSFPVVRLAGSQLQWGGYPSSFIIVPLSVGVAVVPVLVAPHFHPAGSCLQRRLRVLSWSLGRWSLSHPRRSSSRYPPCEWWRRCEVKACGCGCRLAVIAELEPKKIKELTWARYGSLAALCSVIRCGNVHDGG